MGEQPQVGNRLTSVEEKHFKKSRQKFYIFSDFMKNITMVTQFGLSLLTPTLLCLLGCWWLTAHTGIGLWIYIVGFIFGLGSSFMVAYNLYLRIMKKEDKEKKKRSGVSFNSHM